MISVKDRICTADFGSTMTRHSDCPDEFFKIICRICEQHGGVDSVVVKGVHPIAAAILVRVLEYELDCNQIECDPPLGYNAPDDMEDEDDRARVAGELESSTFGEWVDDGNNGLSEEEIAQYDEANEEAQQAYDDDMNEMSDVDGVGKQ